jgi:hypothetical protein
VEEGIIYRMFRQKGATHEEAYKRQLLCTEQRNEMRKMASTESDGTTSKEMDKKARKPPKRTTPSAASA